MDIFKACESGNLEELKYLLEEGVDVNCRSTNYIKWTPLMYACERGYYELVNVLLEWGADCNLKGTLGITALMIASHHGQFKIAKQLLKQKANLRAKADGDKTVLYYALDSHSYGVTLLLHKHSHFLENEEKMLLQKGKYRCKLQKDFLFV